MYHSLTLAGFCGKEPESRFTPDGKQVTNFSVAVDDSYNNAAGEKVKRTIWVRISAWGKLGEVCNQYLHKGSKVLVVGKLQANAEGGPRVWVGQDGTSKASFEVRADTVRFLSSKAENEANAPSAEVTTPFDSAASTDEPVLVTADEEDAF